jgi:hypothetical protein
MTEELADSNAVVSPMPEETLLIGRLLQMPLCRVAQGGVLLLAPRVWQDLSLKDNDNEWLNGH